MNTINALWLDFAAKVIPPGASLGQRKEMKRVFYAGAWAVIGIMLEISAGDGSEEAGAAVFQGLIDECRVFVEGLPRGDSPEKIN